MIILLFAVVIFLMLLVPGLISEWLYNYFSQVKQRTIVATALIFDLFIFIINMIGLRCFNDVLDLEDLYEHFLCLHFDIKYGILSIIVAVILGIIFGILSKMHRMKKSCKKISYIRDDEAED